MDLPIFHILADIKQTLTQSNELILEAPPGAGKSTVVPLELLKEPWRTGKILLLEPRRMAARAVAHRMAQMIGEPVGHTVGYRVRQETRVGSNTNLEVVTGGVLLRLLQSDPALSDYSLIIFDEFHERNLDSDFALSLCLHTREIFRDADNALKLLVMSATLDGERLASFMGASRLQSQGKSHPVDIQYLGEPQPRQLTDKLREAVLSALNHNDGNVLVFLPGQREIQRLLDELKNRVASDTALLPLYGALPLSKQVSAIEPLDANGPYKRKIVLATDIAETSLTIDGISVVIDSCLQRKPIFDPKTGLTRLKTQKVSRASATQRSGRAGRLQPGTCYRLISESTTLSPHGAAEIEDADLSGLILQLLNYGVNHFSELRWLDSPPESRYQSALKLLEALEATQTLNGLTQLSEHGKQLLEFNTHPRLAHMMIQAQGIGLAKQACFIAACLMENNRPTELGNDVGEWLAIGLSNRHSNSKMTKSWLQRVHKQAQDFTKSLKISTQPNQQDKVKSPAGLCLAFAFPDRIGQLRENSKQNYLLSNGRAAKIRTEYNLSAEQWIVAAEVGGVHGTSDDHIYIAAALEEQDLATYLRPLMKTQKQTFLDPADQRIKAQQTTTLGAICVATKQLPVTPGDETAQLLTDFLRSRALQDLPWNEECEQLCLRVELLRKTQPELADTLVACSTDELTDQIEQWLTPHILPITDVSALQKLDLITLLKNYIGWSHLPTVEQLAPGQYLAPSGFMVPIDYRHSPPIVRLKLQEMFGCKQTPTIINGKVTLSLHLLSPAQRPLQVTQDLEGFWQGSYNEVKKEMKGRYPKHPWPDDPANATATRFTKRKNI